MYVCLHTVYARYVCLNRHRVTARRGDRPNFSVGTQVLTAHITAGVDDGSSSVKRRRY